jgi:hypothetical protein
MGVIGVHLIVGEQIVAAVQAAHQGRRHAGISLYEASEIIPVSAVPLASHDPRKRPAQLIHPGGVPRLGNQPQVRQIRVGSHVAEQRRVV